MSWFQILVLAIVQGLTEFLPVSSSAHLILVPLVADWPDQGLAMDIAVHVGSLLAVIHYFRAEVWKLFASLGQPPTGPRATPGSRLAWGVGFATAPICFAGLFLGDFVEAELRGFLPLAIATLVFGVLLGVADRVGRGGRSEYELGLVGVFAIGLAQALAIFPGTSRSGATITMALFLGASRPAAARVSFLLSVPAIAIVGVVKTAELLTSGNPVPWGSILFAVGTSAVCAWISIHFFLKLIERIGMMPFVGYRLVLGAVLLVAWWMS